MSRTLITLLAVGMLACGESRESSNEGVDNQAEEREMLDESSGEDQNPQLVPDDSADESRYSVDTIQSAEGARRQSKRDSID